MKELLSIGPIRVVVFEATFEGTPWDARQPSDVARALSALGWTRPLRDAVQVHADRILEPGEAGDADGFLLGAGEAALVRHADCLPVCIADPVRSRAVLLHCGWKGCALHLAAKGARRLLEEGSDAADLHACIGPGIGPLDFEVGPEVLARFPASAHSRTTRGTPSVDLPGFLRTELEEIGVSKSRITCDLRSTLGDLGLHSHRRAGALAGRMATLCLVAPIGGT